MKPVALILGPMAAADADAIAESQTPAAGGVQSLTLDGTLVTAGVATLDVARRVYITSAGNDSGRTFTVTGTDRSGNAISESITGPNATAVNSLLDYKTVTSVTVDDDTAGAITVGTGVIASTEWYPLDFYRNPFNVSLVVTQSGTATWTVEYTLDRVYDSAGPFNVVDHDVLAARTASAVGNLAFPVSAVRLVTSAYTNPATLEMQVAQSGLQGG